MIWTEEAKAELQRLRDDGLSASKIAPIFGVTRNAVIGAMNRYCRKASARQKVRLPTPPLRLARKPEKTLQIKLTEVAPATIREEVSPVDFAPPSVTGVTLFELNSLNCHWPLGGPRDRAVRFCGQRAQCCGPYCAKHAKIAYLPVDNRKKRAAIRDALFRAGASDRKPQMVEVSE